MAQCCALLVATLVQAPDSTDAVPPIVGIPAQLTLVAFLVVILVVPWLLSRGPEAPSAPADSGPTGNVGSGPLFSSGREKRLWGWTLGVVAAIYLTLSPAVRVAAALRERNLLGVTSSAVMLAVVAFFAVPWIRKRPGRVEVGAALGIVAVYATTLIRLPVPEARSHLFEYSLVAMLVYLALTERRRNGRRVPVPAITAWVATALLGWVDEGIQALLPSRTYDILDVGFNALAALMAIVATLLMGVARRWDLPKRLSRG